MSVSRGAGHLQTAAHCVACLHVHAQEHTYQGSKVTVRLRLVRDGAAADGSPSPGDVCVRVALANCLLMILFTDHHPAHMRGTVGRDMSCVLLPAAAAAPPR